MAEVTPPGLPDEPRRRFDGIAISMWPSMGEIVHGFEIKTSRSDFLSEIKDPAKSGQLMRWCNHFWLVCPPDVAQDDEVPFMWGILHVHKSGMRQRRRAPELTPVNRPSNWWQCMLLRLMTKTKHEPDDLATSRSEGFKDGYDQAEKQAEKDYKYQTEHHESLKKMVNDFEQASGLSMSKYGDNAKLGRLVKALMGQRYDNATNVIGRALDSAEKAVEILRDAHKGIIGLTGEET